MLRLHVCTGQKSTMSLLIQYANSVHFYDFIISWKRVHARANPSIAVLELRILLIACAGMNVWVLLRTSILVHVPTGTRARARARAVHACAYLLVGQQSGRGRRRGGEEVTALCCLGCSRSLSVNSAGRFLWPPDRTSRSTLRSAWRS